MYAKRHHCEIKNVHIKEVILFIHPSQQRSSNNMGLGGKMMGRSFTSQERDRKVSTMAIHVYDELVVLFYAISTLLGSFNVESSHFDFFIFGLVW